MKNAPHVSVYPSLPQNVSAAERRQRDFDLTLARTAYNYMRTYLEPLPLSADVPDGEGFTIDYEAKVAAVFLPIAANFKTVVIGLLERELKGDLPDDVFAAIQVSYEKLAKEMSLNLKKDIANLEDFVKALSELPQDIKRALDGLIQLPKDLEKMFTGLEKVFGEFLQTGVTAFLKSTMFDMLREDHGGNYLQARSIEDYENLFQSLPKPQMLTVGRQAWMPKDEPICEQDWYFGYLQVAGFNTTNLLGVRTERGTRSYAVVLAELQKKFPITDAMFRAATKQSGVTLEQAAQQNRLFVCDYTLLEGATSDVVHGEQRYVAAPIALFYWNPTPPEGYPPGEGVLQPVAIQLGQQFDAETTPIFTPHNASDANDENGFKWKIAKHITNVVCAIHHESIAHLGACHLTVEPVVVASHRQLSTRHPLLQLLVPHFRFTIQINDDALHSLIIPGGVVATNVGTSIESTRELLVKASAAWRWDEQSPDRLFQLRGVDAAALPSFAFRDDTLLLWQAIKTFVGKYLTTYYPNDETVTKDTELQGWINELVSPLYAGFKGMDGLKATNDPLSPYRIDSRDYLIEIVSHIIYLAGPQHASVNYAQYPLLSYAPGVAGSCYRAPPAKSTTLQSAAECMAWLPPLDIALYTLSFEYLLSGVQYDTFGQYNSDPRLPYFSDPRVLESVLDFQADLAQIEAIIRKRNRARPMPYLFQLPSMIPNSISI